MANRMSKNQRTLFTVLTGEMFRTGLPLTVGHYADENLQIAMGAHLFEVVEHKEFDELHVVGGGNILLSRIVLPWPEIRAIKMLKYQTAEGPTEVLQLLRCRDYLSDRDIFTNVPKFWFDDATPVVNIAAQEFSDELRQFAAQFPEESGGSPLGDLASSD